MEGGVEGVLVLYMAAFEVVKLGGVWVCVYWAINYCFCMASPMHVLLYNVESCVHVCTCSGMCIIQLQCFVHVAPMCVYNIV